MSRNDKTFVCLSCATRFVAPGLTNLSRCINPTCQKGRGFLRELTAASYALAGMENHGAERESVAGVELAEQMAARLRSSRGDVSAKAGEMERNSPLFFGTGDNPLLF